MGRAAVLERVDVRLYGLQVDAVVLGALSQEIRVVDSLGSRENLLATHEHVVRVRPFLKIFFRNLFFEIIWVIFY